MRREAGNDLQRRTATAAWRTRRGGPKICKPGLRTAQSVTVPSSALSPGSSTEQHERLDALCEGPRRPFILELEERLSAVLRTAGFLQVHTPIILSRARLEKMGVFDGSIMEKQVFWIDSKRCLRPMLAPHLYEYMREVGRLRPRPVRLFEVGPCFRRETQGQRHANEFTMLNLVEMGLPEGTDLNARLRELGAMVLDAAGIEGWRMTDEDFRRLWRNFGFCGQKRYGAGVLRPWPSPA